IKPDVSVYPKGVVRTGPTDISQAELIIEFKWQKRDDPFCARRRNKKGPKHPKFLRENKSAVDTLGQITAYASAQLGSQFRTHCYSVLIVSSAARIIRWERGGAIVTTPMQYNEQGTFAEFLHRF
ncbi:hypothetical protein BU15DRAFT_35324, partial [Melanogaster broomeanus]